MASEIERLREAMEAAAAAGAFEEAARLRDRISVLRAAPDADPASIDTAGLVRQRPGAMGIGTSRQQVTPPPGWKPPPKPDLMTNRKPRKR